MRLRELLSGVHSEFTSGDLDSEIRSASLDSRKVEPEALFFALPGSKTDGNRFIKQAVAKGAAAIVSELKPPPAPVSLSRRDLPGRAVAWIQVKDVFEAMGEMAATFYDDPSAAMTVVGVTGTNGKTTTTHFLESIFSRAGHPPGVLGTVGHRVRKKKIEEAINTTPFSLDVHRLLGRMRDQGATHVAMEVSSHALATERVDSVHFDAAVITNFQTDHLDFHKDRESYFEAKARLFEILESADAAKSRRIAVLNRDDESWGRLRRRALDVKLATYGAHESSEYRIQGLATTVEGTAFRLATPTGEFACRLAMLGDYNAYNAAGAAAAALELGISPQRVYEGLADVERVPGRLEPVDAGQGFLVVVDYAHTVDALASTLASLRGMPHRKLISVFGCGGDRDKTKRGPMGVAACEGSDLAIATTDNPRGEEPMAILKDVEAGIREKALENYRIVPDRRDAVYEAIKVAHEGDIVLIAGKGHEATQTLRDKTVHFDDRETARDALKDLGRC
jgi:UDP-N-acetylmuramoyl-L-alanyl-D-glutamate--2,6-diaminopimelate ligase